MHHPTLNKPLRKKDFLRVQSALSYNCWLSSYYELELEAHSIKLGRGEQVRILSEPPITWFKNWNDFHALECF